MERNQAEEMSRAADRITEAVRELTSVFNRFLEYQEQERTRSYQRGGILLSYLGAGGLEEGEVKDLASSIKSQREYEPPKGLVQGTAPTPPQVRARREALARDRNRAP
jgi:hypothetical protein